MKPISICGVFFFLIAVSCSSPECKVDLTGSVSLNEKYPNITFGILASAKIANLEGDILLCFNGKKYSNDYLEKSLCTKISEAYSFQSVEDYVEKLYIEHLLKKIPVKPADSSDMSKKSFAMEHITEQISISEGEAREYLDRNRIWFDGEFFEQIADRITRFALDDKKQRHFEDYIREAGTSVPIIVSKAWIEKIAPTQCTHPVYDTLKNGKASIVIFSYGCCKPDVMLQEIENLKRYHENRFNIIHIDSHKDHQITKQFKVSINPTTFLFDVNGKLICKIPYYYSAIEIMEKLIYNL